jgi:transcriptional regulator with XRE-family HTH domain
MEEINARIRGLRKKKGLTGAELAELIGVSQGNVSDWENTRKKSTPSAKALIAIALNLDVSLDWLMLGKESEGQVEERVKDQNFDISPEEYDLIVKLRALDVDNQAEAIEIIERKYARLSKDSQPRHPSQNRLTNSRRGGSGEEAAAKSETA